MIYVDGTPMARYVDESDRWVCMHDGTQWPVLCFEPAAAAAAAAAGR
jgi:hypothetical protein